MYRRLLCFRGKCLNLKSFSIVSVTRNPQVTYIEINQFVQIEQELIHQFCSGKGTLCIGHALPLMGDY